MKLAPGIDHSTRVIRLTIGDSTKTLGDWAKLSPVGIDGIRKRLRRGMSPADAVFLPSTNMQGVD